MKLNEIIQKEIYSIADKITIFYGNKIVYQGTIMNIPENILNLNVNSDLLFSDKNRYEIHVTNCY